MLVSDLLSKLSCTYCQDEVSGVLIKCVVCKDFSLCLQCFAAGAEIGSHENNHAYQFIDSEALDVFKSKGGWSAREELLLLNGIEGFGFGNWKDIALKLENRTPEECKEEYIRTFLEGSIGRATWSSESERKNNSKLYGCKQESAASSRQPATTPPRTCSVDMTPHQSELLVYMPNRDDFDKEFNNNAESIISHLNISSTEDDELDVALKLAQVDMYVEQLRERKRRKRVAREYHLISKFFSSLNQRFKGINQDQIDVEEKLKFLCQFLTSQEWESLTVSWVRQLSLRRRASELARYRRAGLTRYEEIPHFEQETIYRSDTKTTLLLNPNSSSPIRCARCSQGESSGALSSPESAQSCLSPPHLQPPATIPQSLSTTSHLSRPPPTLPQIAQLPLKKSERSEDTECCSTGRNCTCPTDIPRSSLPTEPEQERPSLPSKLQQQQQPTDTLPQQSSPRHLLSNTESKLCNSLGLTPTQYISIKTHLLIKCPETPEHESEKPILDFMNGNNWFIS